MHDKMVFFHYYKILGVKPGSTPEEIRAAFRKKAKLWHPDRLPEGSPAQSSERFKDANKAFQEIDKYYKRFGEMPLTSFDSPASVKRQTTDYSPPPVDPSPTVRSRQTYHHRSAVKKNKSIPVSKPKKRSKLLLAIVLGVMAYMMYTLFISSDSVSEEGTEISATESTAIVRSPPPFTFDSTMGEVLDAQGKPDRVEHNVWFYGKSKVAFNKLGRVKFWLERGTPLNYYHRASVVDSYKLGSIAVGSSEEEVIRLQGAPMHITDEGIWIYGSSRILFRNGHVIAWENSTFNPLNVKE